jgi:hypothetical protein
MTKLISGWRWAATKHDEASLQTYLPRRGLPVPVGDHILKNSRKVNGLHVEELGEAPSSFRACV